MSPKPPTTSRRMDFAAGAPGRKSWKNRMSIGLTACQAANLAIWTNANDIKWCLDHQICKSCCTSSPPSFLSKRITSVLALELGGWRSQTKILWKHWCPWHKWYYSGHAGSMHRVHSSMRHVGLYVMEMRLNVLSATSGAISGWEQQTSTKLVAWCFMSSLNSAIPVIHRSSHSSSPPPVTWVGLNHHILQLVYSTRATR